MVNFGPLAAEILSL